MRRQGNGTRSDGAVKHETGRLLVEYGSIQKIRKQKVMEFET
jgi:hypothetical protein